MPGSRFPLSEAVHVYLHQCILPPERQKRYGPRQRGLNLLIGQCQCCADHGCNLCVVSACMCCPINGISIGCDLHPMASSSPIIVTFGPSCSIHSARTPVRASPPCTRSPRPRKKPQHMRLFSPHKSRLRMLWISFAKAMISSLCSSISLNDLSSI